MEACIPGYLAVMASRSLRQAAAVYALFVIGLVTHAQAVMHMPHAMDGGSLAPRLRGLSGSPAFGAKSVSSPGANVTSAIETAVEQLFATQRSKVSACVGGIRLCERPCLRVCCPAPTVYSRGHPLRLQDCAAFVALFAPEFSVQDPFGSPPVTNSTALYNGCTASNAVFQTVTVFPVEVYVSGLGAGALWTVKSVTTKGCQLDFTGVDAIMFDSNVLITSIQGFFDTTVAAQQMNCTSV